MSEKNISSTTVVPLYNFKFHNHPSSKKLDNNTETSSYVGSFFIGREEPKRKFLSILKNSHDGRGSFLIAGYRGAGKTAFVNHVLEEYEENSQDNQEKWYKKLLKIFKVKEKIIRINVNLGNDDQLETKKILCDLVRLLHKKTNEYFKLKKTFRWTAATVFILFFITLNYVYIYEGFQFIPEDQKTHGKVIEYVSKQSVSEKIDTLLSVFSFDNWTSFSPILVFVLFLLLTRTRTRTRNQIIKSIEELKQNIDLDSEYNAQASLGGVGLRKKLVRKPISTREIESDLMDIINLTKDGKIKFIFIFDELDKISTPLTEENVKNENYSESKYSIYARKEKVDRLLGSLKNLITSSHARFIFIGGREILDSYLGDSDSISPLYDSLFTATIYVPSLLTDSPVTNNSYRLAAMTEVFVVKHLINGLNIQKKDVKSLGDYYQLRRDEIKGKEKEEKIRNLENTIITLRNFIHYLTFRSWGNMKRMHSLFESFVVTREILEKKEANAENSYDNPLGKESPKHYLYFGVSAQRRIVMASNVYILMHHQLNRRLISSDDKLTVSAFFIANHILKYHKFGFSRWDLDRISISLDFHRSPELNELINVVVDRVLKPYLRLVRNSLHRYRFYSNYEQEIRFISQTSDIESAAYNFSISTVFSAKKYYSNALNSNLNKKNSDQINLAELNLILGKLNYWEKSYDDAQRYFNDADGILDKLLYMGDIQETRYPVAAILYAEAVLFQGLIEEKRHNFTKATTLYQGLSYRFGIFPDFSEISLKNKNNLSSNVVFWLDYLTKNNEPKLDVLGLGMWSLLYLNLKRGAVTWREKIEKLSKEISANEDFSDEQCSSDKASQNEKNSWYSVRLGTLLMFLNSFRLANREFRKVAIFNPYFDGIREKDSYLSGHALLRMGLSITMGYWCQKHKCFYMEKQSKRKVDHFSFDYQYSELVAGSADFAYQEFEEYTKPRDEKFTWFKYEKGKTFFSSDYKLIIDLSDKESGNIKYRLCDVISNIKKSAEIFRNSALYVESAQACLAGIIAIGICWEMIPWREIEKDKKDVIKSRLKEFWGDVIYFSEYATESLAISHDQAYSHFNNTYHHRDLKKRNLFEKLNENIEGEIYTRQEIYSNSITALLSIINDKKAEGEMINKMSYWQHSPVGQIVTVCMMWVYRMKYHISQEKLVFPSLYLNVIPNISVRAQTIALWVGGRNHQLEMHRLIDKKEHKYLFRKQKNSSPTDIEEKIIESAIESIYFYYSVYMILRRSTNNNQDLSFPPIGIVLYNMLEILSTLLIEVSPTFREEKEENLIKNKKIDEVIEVASQYLRCSLIEKIENSQKEVSHFFLHYTTMKTRAIEALRMIERLNDTNSRPRRDVLYTKNFLDDDYEDIIFQTDWTFYQSYGLGAYAHQEAICNKHKKIQDVYKEEESLIMDQDD